MCLTEVEEVVVVGLMEVVEVECKQTAEVVAEVVDLMAVGVVCRSSWRLECVW